MKKALILASALLLLTGLAFAGGGQEEAPEPVVEAEETAPAAPTPEEGGKYVPDIRNGSSRVSSMSSKKKTRKLKSNWSTAETCGPCGTNFLRLLPEEPHRI